MHRSTKWQAALFAMVLACGSVAGQGMSAASKAAPAKARPMLATGAAFAPDGRLWVVGLDAQSQLFVQTSADEGSNWEARRLLDTRGDPISADGENRPKIAFGRDAAVVSYTKPQPKPYTGDIRMLRSEDGGKSFSPPFTVHDDRQAITHRFESIAFDRKGDLYVTWIDKRDAEAARARSGGQKSAYTGAAIYAKVSGDGGKTFSPDRKLADSSCECCRIALADSPEGGMTAMWRHVFDGSVRDHALAPLAPGASAAAPVRASEDGWVLAACPHHGPGLTAAAGGGFHAVWFGLKAGKTAVRYGRLQANGKPDGRVRELPDDKAEHADVIASGNKVSIVWRSFDGERTRLRAWLSVDGGEQFVLRELQATKVENDHPRLVGRGNEHFVVWRTEGGIHVQKLAL